MNPHFSFFKAALRLLTLAGFLHFYGLNNGYTYSIMVSKVDAGRSLGVVHFVVRDFCGQFTVRLISRPLDHFRGLVVRSTLGVQSALKNCFFDVLPSQADDLPPPQKLSEQYAQDGSTSVSQTCGDLRYDQENCIKESKDNWISADKFGKKPLGNRSARLKVRGSERLLVARDGAVRQIFWRYQTLLRYLALKSGRADDDLGFFCVNTRPRMTRHALTGFLRPFFNS